MSIKSAFVLLLCIGLTQGCTKLAGPPSAATNGATAVGLEPVRLFSQVGGSSNFIDDVTPAGLAASLATVQARSPGAMTSLSYTRITTFPHGSAWTAMATTRSNTYAAALSLLRRNGIQSPVLISVSQVEGFLKYNDDLWYSALELALNQSIPGSAQGRGTLADQVLSDLQNQSLPSLQSIFAEQQTVWGLSQSARARYWAQDPFQYKPLSFYTGDALETAWVSDRLLLAPQTKITGDDAAIFNTYYQSGAAGAKMLKSLRAVFAKVSNRPDPALFSNSGVATLINAERIAYSGFQSMLWPPSSPGVLERLSPAERAQYDGLGVAQPAMNAIVKMVENGALSLKPNPDEGYLVYQRYAIEPLLTFSHMPEGKVVQPAPEIFALWEEVYKAASAKIQETQQKAIDTGSSGTGASWPLKVQDRLWLEPVPSFYLREFQAYSFLEDFAKTLPADFLWQINGTSAVTYFDSLATQMLSLYVLSSRQLGVSLDQSVAGHVQDLGEALLFTRAAQFLQDLENSPAMNSDQRFIAVQGRPGGPKSSLCNGKPATFWAAIGIEAVPVHVLSNVWTEGADKHPAVVDTDMVVLVDHFNEINACVDQPLNREEWRQALSSSTTTEQLASKILRF